MLRVLLIPVCLTFLLRSISTHVAADEVNSLAGVYVCEGVNPDGQPYTATLEVAQYGEHVRARWTFPDGPPVLGLGLLRHGVLAISYFSPGTVGLVVYRVVDDKITVGEWITAGAKGVYRESLTKLPDNHVPLHPKPQRQKPQPASHFAVKA